MTKEQRKNKELRNQRLMALYGMSPEDSHKAWNAYGRQRSADKMRKIDFNLSFEEWIDIWQKSGHFDQRGKGPSKYCMCRYGDLGAYTIGNVFIQTNSKNSTDAHIGNQYNKNRILTEERKKQISDWSKNLTPEERQAWIDKGVAKRKNKKRGPYKVSASLKGRISPTKSKKRVYQPDGTYYYEQPTTT
jgi:hypothetical protein